MFWWARLNRALAAAEWLFVSRAARSPHSLLQKWAVCKRQGLWGCSAVSNHLVCGFASAFFASWWECVWPHSHVSGSGLESQKSAEQGTPAPILLSYCNEMALGKCLPLQKHTPKTAPLGSAEKAMWPASWAAPRALIYCKEELIFKNKRKW